MEKQRLLYLSNERFPAKLACTIQQMVMCEAFAKAGTDVTLLYPHYHDTPKSTAAELAEFYGVEPIFNIKTLPSILHLSKPLVDGNRHFKIPIIGGVSVLLSTWWYVLNLLRRGQLDKPTIAYSRNVNGAHVFFKVKQRLGLSKPLKIIFEVHSLDQQTPVRFFHTLLQHADGLVCISNALKQALVEKFGVNENKILVAHDGVRQSALSKSCGSKEKARSRLNLNKEKIVLYTGQLLPGKGADVFVEAAKHIPDALFVLVGGHGIYLQRMRETITRENIQNVQLEGFIPPAQVVTFQQAADVLVLPATADHKISAYTSPLKLFEYMAAHRPIVSSDLPVLQEILSHEKNALLFSERDARDLAEQITRLLADDELSEQLATQAKHHVQNYTWEKRALNILKFINNIG